MSRKLRMGMVGGGQGAFIGAVHRRAAALDGGIELVCGAFDVDPVKGKAFGPTLYLDPARCYGDYREMIGKESKLPEGERMDFVTIVTPNHTHFPIAKACLEAGFHVYCEKPMTFSLAEAKELEAVVEKTGLVFGLNHNYTGYPMVKEARNLVKTGALGPIRRIVAEYPQGWLATCVEATGNMQASWRTDPKRSGAAGCIGDIGTHAENLAEYITGLTITELCADLTTFVPGRLLDDDGNVLLRFDNGARGILYASQVSIGEENALHIRVYGEKGALEWDQQQPNTLIVKWADQPMQLFRTGGGYLSQAAADNTRQPAGHPEGFIEAVANLYRTFGLTIRARMEGREPKPEFLDFPNVHDGVRGMAFIESVVEASKSDQKWYAFKK